MNPLLKKQLDDNIKLNNIVILYSPRDIYAELC